MHDDHHLALIHADRHRLVRAVSRLLGPTDAEDAVQDAYVRALEADAPELHTAQAWLLTVARNLAIDGLRRHRWMQQWLVDTTSGDAPQASPSAEIEATLAEEVAGALRLLAAHLTPMDGAAVLLYEVFEASHAEIALATGKSEAGSRQQLRRALLRLRQAADISSAHKPHADHESGDEALFRLYLRALQQRDPQALWAMLREPPISASATVSTPASEAAPTPYATTSGVMQVGGQLGLVLTLDGITLCVVPLGVLAERDADALMLP